MQLSRICVVSLFFIVPFLAGCGSQSGTQVMETEVRKDPSLGDAYYDQAAYDKAIQGDAK